VQVDSTTTTPTRVSFLTQTADRPSQGVKPKIKLIFETSREQRPLTDKELDDALKSDADKAEDAEWDDYTLDEYDDYYDTDFSAQWAEPISDGEDYTIDNERDNW